jgi:hypothetical protein
VLLFRHTLYFAVYFLKGFFEKPKKKSIFQNMLFFDFCQKLEISNLLWRFLAKTCFFPVYGYTIA